MRCGASLALASDFVDSASIDLRTLATPCWIRTAVFRSVLRSPLPSASSASSTSALA
jgi:hypothetical protein